MKLRPPKRRMLLQVKRLKKKQFLRTVFGNALDQQYKIIYFGNNLTIKLIILSPWSQERLKTNLIFFLDTEKDKKKKKDKKKAEPKAATEEAKDAGFEVIDEEEVDGTVKTAAQKKKEKRERQKQKEKNRRIKWVKYRIDFS